MADKSFNDKPMLVVVSDALDPRIKRQLQSQLQAEMLTVGELDAEIKNQESMQAIKQQYDSSKDESKFDENETKEQGNAEPIEQTADNNASDDQQGNGSGTEADPFSSGGSDSGAAPEDNAGNEQNSSSNATQPPASVQPAEGNGQSGADAFSADGADGQNSQGEQKQPAQADQSQQAGSGDPFGDDSGQTQEQKAPEQNQQAQNNQQANPQQQQNQSANGNASNADGGDDPFSDDVKFEAFAGIFNDHGIKFEDAKQTDAEKETHPPLKQIVYIAATDRGVDDRTSSIVSSLEDPNNTVVVVDITDLTEAEAKMQFSAMKKSLQERGVTVVDTTDQAVDFLNEVYDQIAGKGNAE